MIPYINLTWQQLIELIVLLAMFGLMRSVQDVLWFFGVEDNFWHLRFLETRLYPFYSGHRSIFECLIDGYCLDDVRLSDMLKQKTPAWLRYNPSIIFLCDFWHFAKHCEFIVLSLMFVVASGNWIYLLLYPAFGKSFVIFYDWTRPND